MYISNTVENFCTTLPSYIIELINKEAKSNQKTVSQTLQYILEDYLGILNWREKFINDIYKRLKAKYMLQENISNIISCNIDNESNNHKILFDIKLPFKAEMGFGLERVQFKVFFSIHTSAKNKRKTFRSFYSSYQDILRNHEFILEEYARYAYVGYKAPITINNIESIKNYGMLSEKIVNDIAFLYGVISRYKWE